MKLLTFRRRGERTTRIGGMSVRGQVVDLNSAYASYLFERGKPNATNFASAYIPTNMVEFIEGGEASLEAAKTAIAYVGDRSEAVGLNSEKLLMSEDEIEFAPPIMRPGKMICAGMNYKEHLVETGDSAPQMPVGFVQVSSTLTGHRSAILWTPKTHALDYEIELAFVMGKKAKYVKRDEAMDHVYGYTIFNDVSERVLNLAEMKKGLLLGGKNMDTFGPIGPWIITRDEIKDPSNLTLTLRVNGEIRQNSNTKEMIYDIPDLVAYWSGVMTLYPGDIFSTGTPSGVAFTRKPSPDPYYLKPGDVVEAEIEGLGVLMNRVVKEEGVEKK
jgi:acylpyruvate hydrolase